MCHQQAGANAVFGVSFPHAMCHQQAGANAVFGVSLPTGPPFLLVSTTEPPAPATLVLLDEAKHQVAFGCR